MKRTFLYRLLKHSRLGFTLLVFYILFYAVVFYKKMDMSFFPYNSMFTVDFTQTKTASTYAVKVNGQLVEITHKPYWKKDFLETSLANYCKYLQQGQRVFLEDWLVQKISDQGIKNTLLQKLIPGKVTALQWQAWYCHFAGYPVPVNSTIELMQYHFRYESDQAILTDSISIYKTISR